MRICIVDGCDKKWKSKKLCSSHYYRLRKYGDPEYPIQERIYDPEEAFAARTEWQGDCLIWSGTEHSAGYGLLSIKGKYNYVHRYAWEREHGPIPEGIEIDHQCHNRACCNVEHLREVTSAQNKWNRSGKTKENKSGHRNVYQTRSGRWYVQIQKHGVRYRFGTHDTREQAAAVENEKRKLLFGEYAGKG